LEWYRVRGHGNFSSWLWSSAGGGGGDQERKTVFSLNLTDIVRTETYPGTLDSIFLKVVFDWRWFVAGETSQVTDQDVEYVSLL